MPTFGLETFRFRRGFTLVELLVAVTVLVIVAGIGYRSTSLSQKKARDAVRKKHLQEISTVLRAAYYDKWTTPVKGPNNYPGGSCSVITGAATPTSWGFTWTTGGVIYMQPLPKDPKPVAWDYCYDGKSDSQDFRLSTQLENTSDPDINSVCNTHSSPSNYNYCVNQNGVIKGALPW